MNAEDFIEDSILCVANQEYRNIEHIFMDGKSTDSTLSILSKYEKLAGVKWYSEKDQSPAEAANKGLRKSTGDIVCILPADDLFFPWTVGTVVRHFESHPEVDLIYGDMVELEMGEPFGFVWSYPPTNKLPARIKHIPLGGTSLFWRKHVTDELGGFNESLKVVADWDFTLRAMKFFRISKAEEVLSCFRARPKSKSISGNYEHEKSRVKSQYFDEPSFTLQELIYRASWAAGYVRTLINMLAASSAPDANRYRWRRFAASRLVSKRRVLAEIPLSPLVSTFVRFERRVKHGYVNSRMMRDLCTGASKPILTTTSQKIQY